MHPWTCVTPAWTATSELATAHPASLWQWMPSWALVRARTSATALPDRVGQRSAVGVAEDECLGTLLLGCRQHGEREIRVVPVAVEEVLGVEEHTQVVGDEVAHRITHHVDRFVERRAQRLRDVAVPRLGHDAGDRRARVDEIGQDGVILGPHAGTARRPEGDQRRRGELQLLAGPGEELDVLGVGAGPAALDDR